MTSNNNIRDGMVSQIFATNLTNNITNYTANILNFAMGIQTIDFGNNVANLSNNFDCYIPQAVVINLYPGQNVGLAETEYIYNVCHLFRRMRLVLHVSGQNILQLPLSLLCELKPPELHDGKIYIKIPFESLFNEINMNELYFSTVSFVMLDSHEIANYSDSFSLITKLYIHDQAEQSRLTNRSTSLSFIQQIGTLSVSVTNPDNRRRFQLQTNTLFGSTKGLLIQCDIDELQSIQFYVNNTLRFDYGRYLILNSCVKLSEKLLYMPFTDYADFLDRGVNTFSGSINLTRLQSSTLCLEFSRDQPRINIHNVYYNYFRQTNGLGGLAIDYSSRFVAQTTDEHPIQPIQPILPNANIFDMSGNYVNSSLFSNSSFNSPASVTTSNGSTYDLSGNYITPIGTPTRNYINTMPIPDLEYPVPNGNIVYRLINIDRNICYITHDTIAVDQNYMTCSNCQNHFIEGAIKQWLGQRSGSLRNCPTCRELWTNYTVYINRNELD